MQKIKTIKLFFSISFIFLFSSLICTNICTLYTQAQTDDTDCIICSQFVPECRSSEKLIRQTCKQCAHCEPVLPLAASSKLLAECQKCTFHFQCPRRNICSNDCCILNPKRKKSPIRIKPGCEKCFKNSNCPKGEICRGNCCSPKIINLPNKILKNKETKKPECKTACGLKCCKDNERCITVNQCNGKEKSCHLPTLKYCNHKFPESLKGRLNPL